MIDTTGIGGRMRTAMLNVASALRKHDSRIDELERSVRMLKAQTLGSNDLQQFDYSPPRPVSDLRAISSSYTLDLSEMNQVMMFDCSSNSTITLPQSVDGSWIEIYNCGSATLTVQYLGATICAINGGWHTRIDSYCDTSGAVVWPTSATICSLGGKVASTTFVAITNAEGVWLQAPGGAWWRVTVDNAGNLVRTATGVSATAMETLPSPA